MNRLSQKVLILVAGAALTAFHSSDAATFNIPDGPNGGVAALINAINMANNNGEADTINLATNGNYILTTIDNSAFYGPSGLPVIGPDGPNGHSLVINGNHSTVTRDANAPAFRIFTMANLPNHGGYVEFHNILITNGNLGAQNGSQGGGIYCFGIPLQLYDCTISGNMAGSGGGIFVEQGFVTLNNCTFNNNSGGGAIWNQAVNASFGSSVILYNCTLIGNTTSANYPASSGVYCYSKNTPNQAVDATLANCTVSGNGIGDFHFTSTDFAAVTIASCILQESPLDPASEIIDDGYNLSTDYGSGWLTQSTDQLNTNPGLDPLGLQDNGGPTQTIALTYGSAAIDKGNSGLTTDQRGLPRPYDNPSIPNASGGNGSDIGAYEAPQDPVQGGYNFIVTTIDDHDDGVCGGIDCSLREAVARANKVLGPSSIVFARNLQGSINLSLGEMVVSNSLTISNLSGLAGIDGSSASRVFNFTSGSSTLNYLTIQNGFNQLNNFLGQTNTGGGIFNSATLHVNSCSFFNNRVVGGSNFSAASGGKGEGGAIYNSGTLFLDSSTFAQTNGATGGNGGNGNSGHGGVPSGNGGAGQGGAIFNDTGGSLTVTNSTFSQNMVLGGNGGSGGSSGGNGGNGIGAAIFNLGTMTITSATISGNSGSGGTPGTGGTNGVPGSGSSGVTVAGGTATVANTIIAGNPGNNGGSSDADGAFSSSGYNLIGIGDFSSGFTATGDQVGTTASPINPQLGPLQYNGGGTNTMALLSNSPAIDRGKSFGLTSDQRGRARTLDTSTPNASGGDGTDIGAYELGGGLGPFAAVSRKFHGGNTNPFDVPLPLTGPIGVECRRNTGGDTTGLNVGRDHEVVVTFASNLSGIGSIAVKDSNNNMISSTFTTANNAITIDLHSVPNAPRRLSLGLSGVSDGTDTVSIQVPMGVLAGDTTGDGTVNSSDVSQTKSRSGQTVGASNFRNDVTVDGTLNSSDVSLVKSKSGTALP